MTGNTGSSLTDTYLELRDDGSVERITVTPDFWPSLTSGRRQLNGRLAMAGRMTEDMAHWEMHPAGDEILLLLSGRVTAVIETTEGVQEITLGPGEACVVPRGHWHRVKVVDPGELVFITPGEGTEHRPL